ncbi:MAG TPA: PSD1 and planctomycete cytochrome C domain-containing protein [Bryobacteraceae bacterium]|nr:PSD1 and planctomycete cytochrome C domain-containing protein [Bryobacteraceae bacterium]
MRVALLLCAAPLFAAPDTVAEQFERKVRPILANRCYGCHSSAPLGGLAVNSRNALLKGGKNGPAVVPGKPEESLLIQAVTHANEKMKMPMGAPRMPDSEIAVLTEWVKAGAYWPEQAATNVPTKGKYVITPEQRKFWAFLPVVKPDVPAGTGMPLDRFVGEALRAKGLTANPPAARRDLIRRAYMDLTGLPPSFAEAQAFEKDRSPDAFAKVVDRLLASPQYGERWARHWLDVARYADDRMDSDVELPYPNSFRYRNWVIQAFNQDMPYDLFVKAQIAGDQLDPQRKDLAIGLGFYGLSPELTDDRVDVTTRGFLALTGACAQCHDHKFDPIPTKDYYALQGVFSSTKRAEYEMAPAEQVKAYKTQEKKINDVKKRIESFLKAQAEELAEMLASESPRYIRAARHPEMAAEGLDKEVLARWVRYLKTGPVDNKYLHGWEKESFDLSAFRQEALAVLQERKKVDEKNLQASTTNDPSSKGQTFALPPDRYFLWRDLYFNDFYGREFKQEEDGVLWFGPNRGYYTSDGTIERFLTGRWKGYLADMRAELKDLQTALPAQYAFAHVIKDNPNPINERVQINGVPENLGEEAPRAFLSILSPGEPKAFSKGSGRLELAEAIANRENPLTARVMVNRIWQHHFGEGLVRTVSNFGRMGETPSHPALLDYLSATFMENGWSMKKLHREIMLSETYQRSADRNEQSFAVDPDNRLLWRANRQRLDAESMRDTLLRVSGELELTPGEKPAALENPANRQRSVYGMVSRRKLDGTLALFDFPNPNLSAEKRIVTATPLQQLYFLNGEFLAARAEALAKQLTGSTEERIRQAYRKVYAREATPAELQLGKEFVAGGEWRSYAQALLSGNELLFVN